MNEGNTTKGEDMKMTINSSELTPLHDVREEEKLNSIANSMATHGWVGRPVLVLNCGDYLQALTGSHRIVAAEQAGIDVEILKIEQPICTGDNDEEVELFCRLVDGDDDDRREALTKLSGLGMVPDEAAQIMEEEEL